MQGLLAFLVYAVTIINSGQASTSLIRDYIAAEATLVGAPVAETLHIADTESSFNHLNVGDHGTSFGIFQIHLPAHQDITEEQAENIVFSTEWSVSQLKAGNCSIWSTCDGNLIPASTTLKTQNLASGGVNLGNISP